jgi:hypothetical protein
MQEQPPARFQKTSINSQAVHTVGELDGAGGIRRYRNGQGRRNRGQAMPDREDTGSDTRIRTGTDGKVSKGEIAAVQHAPPMPSYAYPNH